MFRIAEMVKQHLQAFERCTSLVEAAYALNLTPSSLFIGDSGIRNPGKQRKEMPINISVPLSWEVQFPRPLTSSDNLSSIINLYIYQPLFRLQKLLITHSRCSPTRFSLSSLLLSVWWPLLHQRSTHQGGSAASVTRILTITLAARSVSFCISIQLTSMLTSFKLSQTARCQHLVHYKHVDRDKGWDRRIKIGGVRLEDWDWTIEIGRLPCYLCS